jgi:beta-glucosidase/6-phospho-beta-glucosidase/beta-galactosidase
MFMFATGVECSNPRIDDGRVRVDQMEACGHYRHWRRDFDLVEELGIQFLRYGPPLHRTHLGANHYDWEFADLTFSELKARDIVPIADLCHFGIPDWLGDFQNPDFPELFATYCAAFAQRFPWVQLYTPINEMFVCALFSARYGWWNEQGSSEQTFVTALKHISKANVLAMRAILTVRPDALFVQSESTEVFHAESPAALAPTRLENSLRFIALDLNYAHILDTDTFEYLLDNGMTRGEYQFFLHTNLKRHCVLGGDYYWTNEHRVSTDGMRRPAGEIFGYAEITREYFSRYGLPLMHSETNIAEGPNGDEAVNWLWKEWTNVLRLRNEGLPMLGFTWYSLTDQIDWDSALREVRGNVHPVGLYDLNRDIRPVGRAYKQLIRDWREILPTQSLCLTLPLVLPSAFRGDGIHVSDRSRS